MKTITLSTITGILAILTTVNPTIFIGATIVFAFATLDSIINH